MNDRERQEFKRKLESEGIKHFSGKVYESDLAEMQALSAKTEPTVHRIRREIDEGKRNS